jgi:hypothetical protein
MNVTFKFTSAKKISVSPATIAPPLPLTGSWIDRVPSFDASNRPLLVMALPDRENERTSGNVGVDRAVRLVDQRHRTIIGLAVARNGILRRRPHHFLCVGNNHTL